MGHRLSKIYTRTGDNGTTGLGDGSRVDKDAPRIEAIGTIDELNAVMGLLLTENLPQIIADYLIEIQHTLFDLGGELAVPGTSALTGADVTGLEEMLDELNEDLSPLKEFILPGGSPAAAICHVARTVCRRAERCLFSLSKSDSVPEVSLQFLNRLSDYLFVAARAINKSANVNDVLWKPKKHTDY
ncbi:MAG: cob(I)yrinic acid a,c-diamide adenosyltransferase [Acidiferrobacterales bacterium]